MAKKFMAKIQSRSGVLIYRERQNCTHSPSKEERPRGIGNNMSMVLDTRKSNFMSQQWLQFHIWFIMTLYYKMRQNASILLQNASFITECIGTDSSQIVASRKRSKNKYFTYNSYCSEESRKVSLKA